MRFASFLSGGFITAIVVNPPERKLAKGTRNLNSLSLIVNKGWKMEYFNYSCEKKGMVFTTITRWSVIYFFSDWFLQDTCSHNWLLHRLFLKNTTFFGKKRRVAASWNLPRTPIKFNILFVPGFKPGSPDSRHLFSALRTPIVSIWNGASHLN